MRRGDVVLVSLDPAIGSEANKTRPAMVVSNDGANDSATRHGRGVVTVLPITGNVNRVYPFQVIIEDTDIAVAGLDKASKIQAEQIRSVDVTRIVRRLGTVGPAIERQVQKALMLHLGL